MKITKKSFQEAISLIKSNSPCFHTGEFSLITISKLKKCSTCDSYFPSDPLTQSIQIKKEKRWELAIDLIESLYEQK